MTPIFLWMQYVTFRGDLKGSGKSTGPLNVQITSKYRNVYFFSLSSNKIFDVAYITTDLSQLQRTVFLLTRKLYHSVSLAPRKKLPSLLCHPSYTKTRVATYATQRNVACDELLRHYAYCSSRCHRHLPLLFIYFPTKITRASAFLYTF